VHLSRLALSHLALDEVWWLVSPQNPLKPTAGMAPFAVRLSEARRVAAIDRRIRVSDFEERQGSRYTADTVTALRRRFPRLRFVWLMGSDNLAQLPRWERWEQIFRTVPIAVFNRPSYSLRALAGLPARRFCRRRVAPAAARRLAEREPPAWAFFHTRLDMRSATEIRRARRRMLSQTFKEQKIQVTPISLEKRPLPGVPLGPRPAIHDLVIAALEDGKAEDIVTIDLAGKTTIADEMIIASGRTVRQVVALTERIEAALARHARISLEGKTQGDWVLIDAGDVIVHLFRPEIRSYYNLEKMWGEALPEGEAVHQ
jgi:ribosome silencing factor RsfS/YbeB/iojap/nicotinate (nicotinamide) nucleotide adenylyltransferase